MKNEREWRFFLNEASDDGDAAYARFCRLSREEMRYAIADMARAGSEASTLLINKWLTAPEALLATVMTGYEDRKQNAPRFRSKKEEQHWLSELSCAVLAPLENVVQAQLDEAEAFIEELFEDEDALSDIVDDTWSWHCDLRHTRLSVMLKNAQGRPAHYLRRRLDEMLSDPDSDFSRSDIRQRLNFFDDGELTAVLQEYGGEDVPSGPVTQPVGKPGGCT